MVFVTVGLQVVSWEIGERSLGRIQLVNILNSKNVHAQSLWSLERRSLKGETRELESVTCPGSARRIGPQSPRQHGAAAAPALALTPACVGHQLSLPRVWDTSSHSRVCGTPALTPACVGHQLWQALPDTLNASRFTWTSAGTGARSTWRMTRTRRPHPCPEEASRLILQMRTMVMQ